jgi:hypothetical protein
MSLNIFAPKRGRIIKIQLYSASPNCDFMFEWCFFNQYELEQLEKNTFI